MEKTQSPPQIATRTRLTEEAYEEALAIQEALRWHAEHRDDVLWTEAERREIDAA